MLSAAGQQNQTTIPKPGTNASADSLSVPGLKNIQGLTWGSNDLVLSISGVTQDQDLVNFQVDSITVKDPDTQTAKVHKLSPGLQGVVDKKTSEIQIEVAGLSSAVKSVDTANVNTLSQAMKATPGASMIEVIAVPTNVGQDKSTFTLQKISFVTADNEVNTVSLDQPLDTQYDKSAGRIFVTGNQQVINSLNPLIPSLSRGETGGVATDGGGAPTGGTPTGSSPTGGMPTGGTPTGGTPTGGTTTGQNPTEGTYGDVGGCPDGTHEEPPNSGQCVENKPAGTLCSEEKNQQCKAAGTTCDPATGECMSTKPTGDKCTPAKSASCAGQGTNCDPASGECKTTTAAENKCSAAKSASCAGQGTTCDPSTGECKTTTAAEDKCAGEFGKACVAGGGTCNLATGECTHTITTGPGTQQSVPVAVPDGNLKTTPQNTPQATPLATPIQTPAATPLALSKTTPTPTANIKPITSPAKKGIATLTPTPTSLPRQMSPTPKKMTATPRLQAWPATISSSPTISPGKSIF